MNINLQARPFELTKGLQQAVRRQLRPLERRFGSLIHSVQVRLEDINGPRGGIDKRCRVVLAIPRSRPVVVEAQSHDMYQAIALASERVQHRLSRQVARRLWR